MADPAPPAAAPPKTITAPPKPAAEAPTSALVQKGPGETDEDLVEVKQLRPYLGAEDKRVMDGKPYSVTRRRAAELHANGLAEFVDPKDHDRHVDDEVRRSSEATRRKYEVKR